MFLRNFLVLVVISDTKIVDRTLLGLVAYARFKRRTYKNEK